MISIPSKDTRKWSVNHASELFGFISNSFNMDFDEPGRAKLARKAMALFTSDSDSDFGRAIAISSDSSAYYVLTATNIFSVVPSSNAFTVTELTTTGKPGGLSQGDTIAFNGVMLFAGSTVIASYSGGTFTDRVTGLSSSYPHPLCFDDFRKEFAVGNGNTVKTYNTSWSNQNTLTIGSEYIVETIRYQSGWYYIGVRNTTGGDAPVFRWNGSTTGATPYPSGSDWVYSIANYEPYPVILTSRGQLKMWNGGGFTELENLPVYNSPYSWTENASTSGPGKCLNRGMIAVGKRLFINIDGSIELSTTENPGPGLVNQPSGLWTYDPNVGLYHRAGYVTEKYKDLSISSLNSSEFVMASAHGAQTGDIVWASSVSNVTGLTTGGTYYAIVTSSTSLKLALSSEDALQGRFIVCTGTISGDKLAFDDLTSVGNTYGIRVGAVCRFNDLVPNHFHGTHVFFTGSSQDVDGNTVSALMSLGGGRNSGNIVTARIPATGIMDKWQKLYSLAKKLHLDTDKIIIKYRIIDRFGMPTPVRQFNTGRATWVTSTSFTIDTRYKDVKSAKVGDEVFFIEGGGAGYSAHITEINDNSSTYTYTIDESIPTVVAGDLSDVYIMDWVKHTTLTNETQNQLKGYTESTLNEQQSSWIELKIELRGFDVSLDMLQLVNGVIKKAE